MKKLLFLTIACALAVTFTACGSSTGNKPELSSTASMAETEVQDTFEDLCTYLNGNGIISGTPIDMNSEIIGASDGRRYSATYDGGEVHVELYEFDMEKLAQIAKEKNYDLEKLTALATQNLESIRKDGSLEILSGKEKVEALLSNNGKYVMIYADPDTGESHLAQRQKAETLFKEFKAS